jgi:hypothetical protein
MIARKAVLSMAAIWATAALVPAWATAAPNPHPAWAITLTPMPSNFAIGAKRTPQYLITKSKGTPKATQSSKC